MANTKQAKKRARLGEDRRQRNMSQRSAMRTSLKKALKSIDGGKKEAVQTDYRNVTSQVDKLAAKGLIHRNKAARYKSRLAAKIKTLAS